MPVWIAPGDICTLKDMPEAHFDHCKTAEWAEDYKPADHVKACLTIAQIDELWLTGHCHDTNSTLPFVRKEGLLFCADDSGMQDYVDNCEYMFQQNICNGAAADQCFQCAKTSCLAGWQNGWFEEEEREVLLHFSSCFSSS